MSQKLAFADDHFHDECGVFGVFGHPEAANLVYLGLYALQHRGQESAGIVSSDGTDLHLHRAMGEVEEIFQPSVLAQLPGSLAIGHTRYSTAGDKALLNAQPIMISATTAISPTPPSGAASSSIAARFSRPTATPKSSCT
jgi:amidophosphoribosyltransferase